MGSRLSRTAERIRNNLGIIPGSKRGIVPRYRDKKLHLLDQYYDGTQYDHLLPWDATTSSGDYIPMRQRKPRVQMRLAKSVVNRLTSKLVGSSVFPKIRVEDSPEDEAFFRVVAQAAKIKHRLIEPVRRCLTSGGCFIRFFLVGSTIRLETYSNKYCYPFFDAEGQLERIMIRYTYFDEADRDELGNPVEKWFRMDLTKDVDIMYDNPPVREGGDEPTFFPVGEAAHNLGFVQGVWLRTGEDKHKADGPSVIEDALELFDAINYNLSQSNQASNYATEPQLAISGLDIDEVDELIRSSTKAWNLGREGDAKFVEAGMSGVQAASELRDKMQQGVQAVVRVCLLDPEKIVGSAQSAKAMEVLHGPMVDLIYELRPQIEEAMLELVGKMAVTLLRNPYQTAIVMPAGYFPESFSMTLSWPDVFPKTMQDLQQKVGVAVQAANGSLISRESLTQWLAKDFGIESVEEELQKIAAQPVINPFGGMF